jgi:hypothetical protein
VLEASYLLFQLRPHHANFNKRLIKAPKLYFYDTGLVCWLLGIQEPAQLQTHPLRGNLFENLVVAELAKAYLNRGERAPLSYWRDSNGNEVDVIIDAGGRLRPVEIKSGQTLNRDYFVGLERWLGIAGQQVLSPLLVYGGDETLIHKGIQVRPWHGAAQDI